MGKNKLQKYERARHLENMFFAPYGPAEEGSLFPWQQEAAAGIKKVLELGCGKGEHSLSFAEENHDVLFIGVDRKSHRMCVGAEKALARNLHNLLFFRVQIERIGEFFDNQSIDAIWIPFPDPHLRRQLANRRLTSLRFLDRYAALLVPGGTVHLKTDSDELFTYTEATVAAWGGSISVASHNIHLPDSGSLGANTICSAFEQKAHLAGKATKYLAFTLR